MAHLEHINVTVRDAQQTAAKLVSLFDWKIRWQGKAVYDGWTVHVGGDDSYLAIYTPAGNSLAPSHKTLNALNHIGVVVDDLELAERRVKAMGYATFAHDDYDPGRRFYFHDEDGLEFEVICYG